MFYEVDIGLFKQWLSAFKPDQIVGNRGRGKSCPLYNYIKSVDPDVGLVTSHTIYIGKEPYTKFMLTEEVVSEFVYGVDALPYLDLTVESERVTAEQALQVLERVCPSVF